MRERTFVVVMKKKEKGAFSRYLGQGKSGMIDTLGHGAGMSDR